MGVEENDERVDTGCVGDGKTTVVKRNSRKAVRNSSVPEFPLEYHQQPPFVPFHKWESRGGFLQETLCSAPSPSNTSDIRTLSTFLKNYYRTLLKRRLNMILFSQKCLQEPIWGTFLVIYSTLQLSVCQPWGPSWSLSYIFGSHQL